MAEYRTNPNSLKQQALALFRKGMSLNEAVKELRKMGLRPKYNTVAAYQTIHRKEQAAIEIPVTPKWPTLGGSPDQVVATGLAERSSYSAFEIIEKIAVCPKLLPSQKSVFLKFAVEAFNG